MKLRLIHKLLIAIFASTALVLVGIMLMSRVSIGRGFLDFLHQQERLRLAALAPELAGWYQNHDNWDALVRDPGQFHELVTAVSPEGRGGRRLHRPPMDENRGPGPRRGPGPGGRPPRGGNAWPERIFLLDSDKNPLIGHMPPELDNDELLVIEVNGAVAGWLGLVPSRRLNSPGEQAFIKRQRAGLLAGLGIGLAVAALLAWLLARHLSRPVTAVGGGIRSLAAGDYQVQVNTRGDDEIARLGQDVNRLANALAEHETARQRWMADIAHELRTPLAIISGELEAMADGVRPLDTAHLASVQEETRHIAALVDDLHNLALTDSGALAYKMAQVDLDELVEGALDSFQKPAADKDLTLSYNGPGAPVKIQGDEQRLRQLVHNLLDNALRYTDAGGRIELGLTADKQVARLQISDTAPGASQEDCDKLFDRLFRLEGSRNRNSGGSGLGLSICRNIVAAHGGTITAEPGSLGGLAITAEVPTV